MVPANGAIAEKLGVGSKGSLMSGHGANLYPTVEGTQV